MSWTFEVKVAVAVIYDESGRILITQRAAHIPSGGLWEFPGGKLEAHETPQAALLREIKEEVNLDIQRFDFITKIDTEYRDNPLSLYVFLIHEFLGKATRLEAQADLQWVSPHRLQEYEFPPTNAPILDWIQNRLSTAVFASPG